MTLFGTGTEYPCPQCDVLMELVHWDGVDEETMLPVGGEYWECGTCGRREPVDGG